MYRAEHLVGNDGVTAVVPVRNLEPGLSVRVLQLMLRVDLRVWVPTQRKGGAGIRSLHRLSKHPPAVTNPACPGWARGCQRWMLVISQRESGARRGCKPNGGGGLGWHVHFQRQQRRSLSSRWMVPLAPITHTPPTSRAGLNGSHIPTCRDTGDRMASRRHPMVAWKAGVGALLCCDVQLGDRIAQLDHWSAAAGWAGCKRAGLRPRQQVC